MHMLTKQGIRQMHSGWIENLKENTLLHVVLKTLKSLSLLKTPEKNDKY